MYHLFLEYRNLRIAKEDVNTAKEIDYTPSQVALNWIRQQAKLTSKNTLMKDCQKNMRNAWLA